MPADYRRYFHRQYGGSIVPCTLGNCPRDETPAETAIRERFEATAPALLAITGNSPGFGLRVERDDGRVIELATGAISIRHRYQTSSTAKPIMCSIAMRRVEEGDLALDTKVVDVLTGFDAVGVQRDATLEHLMSFASGFFTEFSCTETNDPAAFLTCVNNSAVPHQGAPITPGTKQNYITHQLDIMSEMLRVAAGEASFLTLIDEWRAATGLLYGASLNQSSVVPSGALQFQVTAREYLRFIRAVEDREIMTDAHATIMTTSHLPAGETAITTSAAVADALPPGWLFCCGFWRDELGRVATIGNNGQLAFSDREHGYRLAISVTRADEAQVAWSRDEIEPLIEEWCA